MHFVNTRILRPFWSKLVEKHQCYRRKTLKNVKNRVFFEFWRPPRPKIKNRASSGHAPLQYATFEGSLKKIGWETKKCMHLQIWSSLYHHHNQICFAVYYSLATFVFQRLFSISEGDSFSVCYKYKGVVLKRILVQTKDALFNFRE